MLQVLPPLCDLIPEARLNLAVYHLRCNQLPEAHRLLKDLQPTQPQEYILKGVPPPSHKPLSQSMAQQNVCAFLHEECPCSKTCNLRLHCPENFQACLCIDLADKFGPQIVALLKQDIVL